MRLVEVFAVSSPARETKFIGLPPAAQQAWLAAWRDVRADKPDWWLEFLSTPESASRGYDEEGSFVFFVDEAGAGAFLYDDRFLVPDESGKYGARGKPAGKFLWDGSRWTTDEERLVARRCMRPFKAGDEAVVDSMAMSAKHVPGTNPNLAKISPEEMERADADVKRHEMASAVSPRPKKLPS